MAELQDAIARLAEETVEVVCQARPRSPLIALTFTYYQDMDEAFDLVGCTVGHRAVLLGRLDLPDEAPFLWNSIEYDLRFHESAYARLLPLWMRAMRAHGHPVEDDDTSLHARRTLTATARMLNDRTWPSTCPVDHDDLVTFACRSGVGDDQNQGAFVRSVPPAMLQRIQSSPIAWPDLHLDAPS